MSNIKVEYQKTYLKQESTPLQESSQNPPPPQPPSPPPTTTASPPSASSSPTHEFSFTVSLHPHPPPTTTTTTTPPPQPPPPSPAAIDLSPAGEIFFKGHLLPLHHLSHHHDSPRSSTDSMDNDSFTLPINLLYHHSGPIGNTSFHCHHRTTFSDSDEPDATTTDQNRSKSKSFSIFGIPKWKKRCDHETERDHEDHNKERNSRKKMKVDFGQFIKRYMKMVKPLLSFPKSRRRLNTKYNHQSYSFSTNSLSRKPPEMSRGGRRRGQFSAPASMRDSPANSGILLASGCVSPTKSTSESSMEELHAAIQAAIAHCKNSIAMEDKIQSLN